MTTVTYTNSQLYNGNRPYADVELIGPTGRSTYKSLVDTGADYLQLPSSAASAVGLSLSGGKTITVQGAAGGTTMTLLSGLSITIEGISITADVLFHSSGASKPLLGRQALLAAVEAGFNTKEWLWV